MNSDQLVQFKTIAEYSSLTKAAEALYISQPALSKTLKNLEIELGCKLFTRIGNKLMITKEGKRLLEYANTVIYTLSSAEKELRSSDKKRKLRLCSTGYYLPELLEGYYEENISHLELQVASDETIPNMLINKNVDAVVADDYYLRHYTTKDLNKILLFKEQLMLAVPDNHRWAFRDWLPLKEIEGEPLLYININADVDSWTREILKLNRCNLNIKLRLDSILFQQMWENLDYPYLISSSMSIYLGNKGYFKNQKLIRINGLYTSRYLYLWFYKNSEKHFTNVFEVIKNNAAKVADRIEVIQEVS